MIRSWDGPFLCGLLSITDIRILILVVSSERFAAS